MQVKYGYYYRRRKTVVFRVICVLLAVVTGVLLTDAKLRPSVYELATTQARAVAEKTIHTAVEKTLSQSAVSYADIVSITRNDNGGITGITTDIVKMNLFKSQITNAVDDEFVSMGHTKVSVSFGSATGVVLFSGCGPYINVKVGMLSSTQSDFENVFESAGINQTQHSVMLNLSTRVVLTMSGRRITTNVNTSFCVAQTVIVGTVPNVMVE